MTVHTNGISPDIATILTEVAGLDGDAMRGTDSAALASVLGALNNAGADGAVTDTDTAIAYIKQMVTNTRTLEEVATTGLLGVNNSIAYKVHEIERHLHGWDRRYGVAVTPSATHKMDSISVGNGVVPFRIDAGTSDWGEFVQVIGSADTTLKFDFHSFAVVAAEGANKTWFIQLGFGATGADMLTDGTYSELVFTPQSVNGRPASLPSMSRRAAAGSLGWARCLCRDTDTHWLDFYIGMHFYEG